MDVGVDYCRPVKTSHKDFLYSYVIKVDEGLAGRFISCYEEYSNSSWLNNTPFHWVQVKF